jgi:hypothetical protein
MLDILVSLTIGFVAGVVSTIAMVRYVSESYERDSHQGRA